MPIWQVLAGAELPVGHLRGTGPGIHSDLSALKKLLFEVMYEELKQDTERRYYTFREHSLFNLDDPNR